MKIPAKKTLGISKLNRLKFLLYGPPKIGKTVTASGFPNTWFLSCEKNYDHVSIFNTDIASWKDFKDVVRLICKKNHSFKIIVIDTADLLGTYCVEYVCDKLKIAHPTDAPWGKGHDLISREFEREVQKLFIAGFGLIFLSHTKTVEFTRRGMTITRNMPTLPNVLRRIILPKVNVIGYMDTKEIKTKIKGKMRYVTRRVITFDPDEFVEAGDHTGLLPKELVTYKDPKKTYELIKSYFMKGGKNAKVTSK